MPHSHIRMHLQSSWDIWLHCTRHVLHALLTSQSFDITNSQCTGYDVILTAPELNIARCYIVYPADKMVTPEDRLPRECMGKSERFLKARAGLENQPLLTAQRVFFVDGSCFRTDTGNKAVYTDTEAKSDPVAFNAVRGLPTVFSTAGRNNCSQSCMQISQW